MLQQLLQKIMLPIVVVSLAIVSFVLIPRRLYKKYFLYALFLGAGGNVLIILIAQNLLHLFSYKNLELFSVFGVPFLAPIAFLLVHMMFLHFLPVRRLFLYPYLGAFIAITLAFGIVLQNIGVFIFTKTWLFLAPIVYLVWYGTEAWVFRKYEGIVYASSQTVNESSIYGLEKHRVRRFSFAPNPAKKQKQKEKKVRFVKPKKL